MKFEGKKLKDPLLFGVWRSLLSSCMNVHMHAHIHTHAHMHSSILFQERNNWPLIFQPSDADWNTALVNNSNFRVRDHIFTKVRITHIHISYLVVVVVCVFPSFCTFVKVFLDRSSSEGRCIVLFMAPHGACAGHGPCLEWIMLTEWRKAREDWVILHRVSWASSLQGERNVLASHGLPRRSKPSSRNCTEESPRPFYSRGTSWWAGEDLNDKGHSVNSRTGKFSLLRFIALYVWR